MHAMIVQKMICVLVCCSLLLGFVVGARAASVADAAAAEQTARHSSRRKRRRGTVKKMSDRKQGAVGSLAAGTWGGQHIRLSVRADGAAVEFDCAHGTIDG